MIFSKFKKRQESSDPFAIQEGNVGKLKDFSYRLSWTEDSLVPSGGRETVGRTFDFSLLPFIALVLFFFLFLILFRVAWLQIVKGDYYYSMAEGNRIRIQRVEAKRGIIYDRDMKPLVRNTANFLLYFIPADLPDEGEELENTIQEISAILGDKSAQEIKDILAKVKPRSLESYQPLFIKDSIEYEKAIKLILKSENWSGVIITNKSRREYDLSATSFSHILGYTSKMNEDEYAKASDDYSPIDFIGKTGIEHFYEPDLRGVNGKKQIEVDALGKEKKIINETREEDGHNLVLSIDSDLQKKLEEVMASYLERLNLGKASGIVIDPNNGEVLAMVNMPTFNNNFFARGITNEEYAEISNNKNNPLFNRSLSGEYPSGSTIKPVIAVAALEEGIINENTSFLSSGGIRVGEWFFPDWKAGGHGVTNVRKAIAESVNTFFYIIGGGYNDFIGLGVDRIVEYAKRFGLGSQTGIDLAGEASGFLPSKAWKEEVKGERWYIGDTYHLAIGQGDISVTPLQVALYTSVFANGGKLYRPHLVKEILTSEDKVIQEINEEPIRENFISKKNIEIVRQGMRQTVTSGSARSLSELPVAVAGKTGTAQWSSEKSPHAWFTGFAPYDNPKLAITILVEEGVEGSSVSVPIAREVLSWYFSR